MGMEVKPHGVRTVTFAVQAMLGPPRMDLQDVRVKHLPWERGSTRKRQRKFLLYQRAELCSVRDCSEA